MTLDMNKLKQAIEIAKLLECNEPEKSPAGEMKPYIICTNKRGVFFGYTDTPLADPIHVKDARMCIYWTSKIGGVMGLAEKGPFDAVKSGDGSRIGAPADAIIKDISAVFSATDEAAAQWISAPIYGRSK